jgi:hypothetical protein
MEFYGVWGIYLGGKFLVGYAPGGLDAALAAQLSN